MKLLIVDDEPLVRNGLLCKIQWEKLGLQVIGAASNGLEAKEIIQREQPDIVLSDIQMPGMTGIELAGWLKRTYPDVMVIFLSGYSEFEYAKSAIEFQVAHYLLKPVEEDELFAVMDKLIMSLNARNKTRQEYDAASESLRRHLPVLQEHFLAHALVNMNYEEFLREAASYQIELTAPQYAVAKLEFSKYKPDKGYSRREYESAKSTMISSYSEWLRLFEQTYLIPEGEHHVLLIFGLDRNGHVVMAGRKPAGVSLRNLLEEYILRQRSDIVQTTIGLSGLHQGMESLHTCYREASEALEGKYCFGTSKIISNEEFFHRKGTVLPAFDKEKLKLVLFGGMSQPVHDYLREHFHHLKANYNDLVRNEFIIFDIIAAIADILKAYGCSDSDQLQFSSLEGMTRAETLDELEAETAQYIFACMKILGQSGAAYSSRIVERITGHLAENYMKNINLKTISAEFSVHFSYISRVFQEKTGTSFTNYLIEIRMRKAKELLLQTNLPVAQVSRLVGYGNEKYFSRSFKKWAGMTAQEYRQTRARSSDRQRN